LPRDFSFLSSKYTLVIQFYPLYSLQARQWTVVLG
jgi:hypothetical protein